MIYNSIHELLKHRKVGDFVWKRGYPSTGIVGIQADPMYGVLHHSAVRELPYDTDTDKTPEYFIPIFITKNPDKTVTPHFGRPHLLKDKPYNNYADTFAECQTLYLRDTNSCRNELLRKLQALNSIENDIFNWNESDFRKM